MKKIILAALVILCSFLLSSSNTPTPQNYLDTAVLNCDKVAGFAGNALSMELENPPIKKTGKNGEKIPMTRREIIEEKISFSEKVLEDVKNMEASPDANDILSGSIALHRFVIEVYETDYMALAKLYDEGAPKATIAAFDSAIKNKHASMFELHYENLLRGGKLYASRHNIKLKWAI